MANRSGRVIVAFAVASVLAAGAVGGQSAEQRIAERLRALQREADQLASREKTILTELRKLELDRQMKTEELAAIEQDVRQTQAKLADTVARAKALQQRAEHERPDVEARLVRLYKLGRAGYWRLLLDVEDVQSMGRAYRTASVLTRLDAERVKQHQQTLTELTRERKALEARATEIGTLQRKAASARAALDRAVAARTNLLASIESRRELAEQLAGELEDAHQRLQAAVTTGGTKPAPVTLPLKPFRGDIPWPADGIVLSRFGAQRSVRGGTILRNGIEISMAEGRAVSAVHDGVVSFAGPFTGYGNLVIVDHGQGAHSLYGHLSVLSVTKGDRVTPQSRVGLSGRNPSGNPALYFELRVDGKPVDPLQWLRKP